MLDRSANVANMLSGVIVLWAILTAASVAYVALDIGTTPESPVLKAAFIIITLFTGPIGAFLYVLGCREPLPGLHEQYTASRWRQTLGSTMHCVAGDGLGIIAGAVIAAIVSLPAPAEIALEYVLGFGFGWTIFQALFMRRMAGSYAGALRSTFLPELLSMNALMAAMVPVMMISMDHVSTGHRPDSPAFWFIMSMSILAGFVLAYPINWWLAANHLKHGMMTIPPRVKLKLGPVHDLSHAQRVEHQPPPASSVLAMTVFTLALLAVGVIISMEFARM